MEKEILKGLLDMEAIKLNFKEPFVWTSGIKSPIYCDNRLTIGNYQLRNQIASELTRIIKEKYPEVELIGACATAGIPHGTSVADNLKLPLVYYRSKPKTHGMNGIIEGYYSKKQKVVIVEDLISTAKSVKQAIDESRKVGLEVLGVVSIVNYNLKIAQNNLADLDVKYDYILSFEEIKKYLNMDDELQRKLDIFIDNPQNYDN